MNYVKFASTISFYEFIQDEFYPSTVDIVKLKKEIEKLKSSLTIESLSKILESTPQIFYVFEQILQMKRFTDAQYIHFCFDVNTLNKADDNLIIQHAENSILKFENGKLNGLFNKIFSELQERYIDSSKLFLVKKSIPVYIEQCIKNPENLYEHIMNSISSRVRISRYLIENLKADEFISAIDLEKYLKYKRTPRDTKSLHGNFGTIKIIEKFKALRIIDVTNLVTEKTLKLSEPAYNPTIVPELSFVKERYIESITIRKTKKLKKFDFVILKNGFPKILIETNFYTTSGTKIGINVGEYTDLSEDITLLNRQKNLSIRFSWITDGNFWLAKEGENLFNNLKKNYFKKDFELLNYNLIEKHILDGID